MPHIEAGRLQLLPRHLAMVRQVLRDQLPNATVWAYGSRVNGDCYEASDLDLVVRHPSDLMQPTPRIGAAREAFVESDLPIQVQIVDWARIPPAFQREIEAGYVVVQGEAVEQH